jgi:glycosyltransferase involved in cell wall biosynthesis
VERSAELPISPGPRVVINARAAARPWLGGVERWTRELAARLPVLRPGAYVVARPPRGFASRTGHAWEQIVLPAYAAARRADLLLAPAGLAPLAWPRTVAIIHDAAALRHPEWYGRSFVASQRILQPRVARRALRVVTPSQFSADEIVAALELDPASVTVVPGGVGEQLRPDADADGARSALGLSRPYVLTLGADHTRKNRRALGPVASALAEEGVDVVAAGGGRAHMRGGGANGIHTLGHVDDAVLPGLYAGALAFVFPSHHEGFGLPCLEAMASGVPVVAANRGALPETCGDAALLVDPDDRDALVAAVRRAAFDTGDRARLRASGLARAAAYSWEATAQAIDDLLVDVASL